MHDEMYQAIIMMSCVLLMESADGVMVYFWLVAAIMWLIVLVVNILKNDGRRL